MSVLEALTQAVIVTDLQGQVTFWNKAAEKLYGWRAEEVCGRNILEITPTADSIAEGARIFAALKAGERWKGQFQVRRKDGHWFLAEVTNSPVYDANGAFVGIMGISQAVSSPQWKAILSICLTKGRELMAGMGSTSLWQRAVVGVALFALALLVRFSLDAIVPDRLPYVTFYSASVLAAFFAGPLVGVIVLLTSAIAGTLWVVPLPGSDAIEFRITAALVFLTTSGLSILLILYLRALQGRLQRRDDQLALVNRELKHRLQNVLTIASSIAAQTVQSDIPREEISKSIGSRIQAIARAQDLLDADPSKGVDLVVMVERLLQPMAPDPSRLTISGNRMILPGAVATTFALILHELGTNALKYGAWRETEGIVAIQWEGLPRLLDFRWQEYHHQTIGPRVRQGYGSVLIRNGLPQAKVSHEISLNGVNCRIELPV